MGRSVACVVVFSGGIRPLLRSVRCPVRSGSGLVSDRGVLRKSGPFERAVVRYDDGRPVAARAEGYGRFLPETDRPDHRSVDLLVDRPADSVFVYLNYIQPHSANAALPADGFTPQATGVKLYTFIFNFNFDTTPLWYLYMLVGLYLILPILSAWLERATKREIRLFLWVWGATLLLPYLRMIAPMLGYAGNYGHMGLFGECDWNLYGTFYYVSGFIGYLVLAHYLVLYPPAWSWRKRSASLCRCLSWVI